MSDIYKKQNERCFSRVVNALEFLPLRMKARRKDINPIVKGVHGNIRLAAKIVGISPATYSRAENGRAISQPVLLKILYWLDKGAYNIEWIDIVMDIISEHEASPDVRQDEVK